MRDHDVSRLTARELGQARRELRASLALARPDSPARAPILAHLAAIDAELAGRGAHQADPAPSKVPTGQLAGGAMTRYDPGAPYAELSSLATDYPDWRFAVTRGSGGPRLEGYRPGCPAGLYAVITVDPAELRRELDKPSASATTRPSTADNCPAAPRPAANRPERPVVPGTRARCGARAEAPAPAGSSPATGRRPDSTNSRADGTPCHGDCQPP